MAMVRKNRNAKLILVKGKKKRANPAYGRLRGHGAYSYEKPGPWGKIGRSLGALAGSMVGANYGGAPGKIIGNQLGGKLGSYLHYIGRIFGSGDYVTSPQSVRHNVLVNEGQVPQFGSQYHEVRVRHREYLGDVISSGTANTFQISSYQVNPGNGLVFPWLSQVAGVTFQQYRLNGMVFEFRSMSADALNSTNTALGTVTIASDYDSKDNNFANKASMENSEYAVSCKPSSCMIHAIECDRRQTSVSELYINPNLSVPSGADVRLYNMCNTQVATSGFQGTSVNCGELWISYDISLFKPIMNIVGASYLMTQVNLAATDATKPLLVDTSVHATQPFFDTLGTKLVSNTVLTLPYQLMKGTIILLIFGVRGGSTASIVGPSITGSNGLSNTEIFINDNSATYTAPQTATGTTIVSLESLIYDGTGTPAAPPTITFGTAGTFPGATVQGGDLLLLVLNGSLPNNV